MIFPNRKLGLEAVDMPLGSSLRMAFSPDTTPKHPDRRESPRYDMSGAVFLIGQDTEPIKIGIVRDMSLAGAYISSPENSSPEGLLRLRFQVGANFEISGQVCRKDRSGFAVCFLDEAS